MIDKLDLEMLKKDNENVMRHVDAALINLLHTDIEGAEHHLKRILFYLTMSKQDLEVIEKDFKKK